MRHSHVGMTHPFFTTRSRRLAVLLAYTMYNKFKIFHFAVNNAYILYMHDCQHLGFRAKDLLAFHLELVRTMLDSVVGVRAVSNAHVDTAQNEGVCYVKRLCDIGLKRGRYLQCVLSKRKPPHYTSFGCRGCRVRLCKTRCFQTFHQKY